MTHCTQIESPIGPLLLLSDGESLTGLYMNEHKCGPAASAAWTQNDALPLFITVREQLAAYFAGTLTAFDLPLAPHGTPFQQRVWNTLRDVPYGQTVSYGELARQVGSPGAARAVGAANGANPLSIVVPCHRVVGTKGLLTGYAGGMGRKQFLLTLEQDKGDAGQV